jgi:poly(3-hydroxyalkanoate) synthetase
MLTASTIDELRARAGEELGASGYHLVSQDDVVAFAQVTGDRAWLRPNDLVWNYVVNNYLLGKDPPAFDILYWNQDAVRLAAGLHRDFVHLALENSLTYPGALEVLGTRSISVRSPSTPTSSRV